MRRAAPSDRLKLEAAILEMEERLSEDDFLGYLLATFDLHEVIARSSRNAFVIDETRDALDPLRQDATLLTEKYSSDIAEYSLEIHRAMVAAFLDSRQEDFVEAVGRHYEDYPALCAHPIGPVDPPP